MKIKTFVAVIIVLINAGFASELPIINLNKFTKEEKGKKFNHTVVEYKKTQNDDKKIIHEFVDEVYQDEDTPVYSIRYYISYLSQNYLIVTAEPSSPYLFDLNKLQQVELQFPIKMGDVLFFENEKYVLFKGIGRVAEPGLAIEIINGKKVYYRISEEEVFDINVKDGIVSFTESTINDINTKKEINIEDFVNRFKNK